MTALASSRVATGLTATKAHERASWFGVNAIVRNAYVESFNGRLRDECLNEHRFFSLGLARQTIEAWRVDYSSAPQRLGQYPARGVRAAHPLPGNCAGPLILSGPKVGEQIARSPPRPGRDGARGPAHAPKPAPRGPGTSLAEHLEKDIEFHLGLAAPAKNGVAYTAMHALIDLARTAFEFIPDGHRQKIQDDMVELAAALRAKDGDRAAEVVIRHIAR